MVRLLSGLTWLFLNKKQRRYLAATRLGEGFHNPAKSLEMYHEENGVVIFYIIINH